MGIVFDYINKRIEKRELNLILNSINLVEVSKKEIRSMGKNINADIWTTHKKKVLLSWMKSHEKFEHKHQNRAKKYIKKLEIEVDDQIEKLLLSLERREFTTRRAFKDIETPFEKEAGYKGKSAFLVYKSVKFYDNSSALLKLITNSDLYIFDDKLVLFEPTQKKINLEIELNMINKISLFDYGLEIMVGNKFYLLRYKDNYIIKISLERILKKEEIKSVDLTREVQLNRMIKKEDK